MDSQGTQYENLKFRAELVKNMGFAAGTPFGLIVMDLVMEGLEFNGLLPIKVLVAYLSFITSSFLLSQSHVIIEDREWRLERNSRRTSE